MKKTINKLFFGMIFASSISILAAPTIWDGTADESWYLNNRNSQTYTLTTASQLAGLAKLVNREYFSFRGRTIILAADIFLNDTTGTGAGTWNDTPHRKWIPIGTKDFPFRGVFDGSAGTDNHRIYGLYMNSASDSYAGLFGYADSAKIINLDIPVGKVKSKNYVGTLIGYADDTEISNIRVKAEINGSNSVGGLVGGNFSTIIDSYFEGTVIGSNNIGGLAGGSSKIISSHSSGTITGGNFVGGLTGSGGTVTDSYFKGDVRGANRVGGLAGQGKITNSHFEGNVTGADSVGGLVGSGRVFSSHSIGTVIGNNYVGGLAGMAHWGNKDDFDNSYFQGRVIASENFVGGLVGLGVRYTPGEYVLENSYAIANVEGSDYVGGLIGNDSVVEYSSGYADIRISNCYSRGNIKGNSYVGGIIGKCSNGAQMYGPEFIIVACHHFGNVSGDSDYIGGIIGHNDRFRGSIDSSSHDGGDVRGINYVGGLIGFYDSLSVLKNSHSEGNIFGLGAYVGGLAGSIKKIGLLNNSYSKGNITGTGSYVGGVCGYSRGDTVDYVKHSSGNVDGEDYVGGLFGYGSFWRVDHSYHDEGNVGGKNYIGGIIGWTGPIKDKSKKGVLKNSFSISDVHGKGLYTGGMIGYLTYEDVDSLYHVGNVDNEGQYTGGLVGYCYGYGDQNSAVILEIRNSYVIGDYVKGKDNVGGAAGFLRNTCSIYSSYYDGDSVIGVSNVGGLVGISENISDSYSTANVLGKSDVGGLAGYSTGSVVNSYALGDVSGSNRVGGLAGYSTGSVANSYALGDVSGSNNVGGLVGVSKGAIYKSWTNGAVWGDTAVGGLVGKLETAPITDSYVNGNVKGNIYVGGLVGNGMAIGDARRCPSNKINRNYVSGTVNVSDEANASSGCIIGYMYADSSKWGICSWNLDMSYYDSDKCNLGVYGEFHGDGHLNGVKSQAKTTVEMQTQSTFEQWNFTDIWAISESSYPYHQKFANFLPNADVETESLSGFIYDGLPKMPQVKSVRLFEHELTEGVDYTVEYKHNLNAGVARIKVCGINAYSGCKNVKFEITPAPINITIVPIENMVYTGIELIPNITVYSGESLLDASKYTIEYANNLNAGTASVTVTTNGNYVGSATATFTIEKANPVINQIPKASDVLIGESLALSELSDGISNVEGLFVWKVPEEIPTLENEGYAVKFIPTDTANYNSVEIVIPIKVWEIAYITVRLGDMTLDSVVVIKGSDYTLPIVPDSVGYDFAGFFLGNSAIGFSGDVIPISENIVVDAKYSIKIFAVNFVNGEIELQSDSLPYGSLPKYIGSTPIKTASAKYTYTFKGWSPAIETVSKSATYTAVFDSVVNKNVITFVDGNTVLQSGEVEYGTMPTPPTVSLPEKTAQYTYSFGGWDRDIVAVTGAATYSAVINQTVNKYSVVFKDFSGTILKDVKEYDYGTSASDIAKPSNPIRENTAQYTYSFKGWNPVVSDVTEDAEYVAEYDSALRNYTIAFVSGSETLQSTNINYGLTPAYKGMSPTKVATDQYTYTFKGWSPAISNVVGDAVYTALFDSTLRTYTITFVNGSETLQSSEFSYGTMPSYKGNAPTKKETKEYSYTFKGWSPTITTVTGTVTYKAMFDSSLQKYTVIFKNGNDKLQTISVAYGETPKYTGKTPTKKSTTDYSYEFVGWSPKLGPITKGTEFVAVFDSTKVTGMQNALRTSSNMSVNVVSMNIQISAAPIGKTYALIDMQGRILQKGNVESANFNIVAPSVGSYFIRIDNQIRKVNVK